MKAAVYYGPRDIRTEEVSKPKVTDNEILVKVKACGVCGSDLHCYKLGWDFSLGILKRLKEVDPSKIAGKDFRKNLEELGPGIPGHEYSGEVVEIGKFVQGVEKGDKIASWHLGGMAEYNTIPQGAFSIIPPEINFEDGATLEPLANSVHAAKKGSPLEGKNIVIFGMGAIGLGIIQFLKTIPIGVNKIIAIDRSDFRLKFAKKIGADEIINAKKEDPYAISLEIFGPDPLALTMIPSIDIIYDCVGYVKDVAGTSVIEQAMNLIRPKSGRIIVHGLFEESLNLQLSTMVIKELNIQGSFGMSDEDRDLSIQLMKNKEIDRSKLITHEYPLDQAKEAFEMACKTDESVKVLIKPKI